MIKRNAVALAAVGAIALAIFWTAAPAARAQEGATASAASSAQQPLTLSVAGAVLESLRNNKAFLVETLQPQITRTFEDDAQAVFDPVLTGQVSRSEDRTPSAFTGEFATSRSTAASVGIGKTFTSGAAATLQADAQGTDSAGAGTSGLSLNVNQPLLKGAFPTVNLVPLEQTRLDTQISAYELRGFAVTLVAQVEEACWDYALTGRNIAIVEESLALARRQLADTEERIAVGKLAEVERVAAEAEVALRQVDLINARSARDAARIDLLRLVSPAGGGAWTRDVQLADDPATVPKSRVAAVEEYERAAMRLRPDLNQARLQMARGDLELVKTKNGLLPKLDFFVNLGKTGYGDSFSRSAGRWGDEGYDVTAGLAVEWPLFNRAAEADHRRATLTRQQSAEALGNLEQLAQVDVRKAYIEVLRQEEQITASAASRRLQEEKVRAETEKYLVGRSTAFLVSQAQRDLLQSRVAEVQATVGYLKAVVELYRLDGSLLDRRGIRAPGAEMAAAR